MNHVFPPFYYFWKPLRINPFLCWPRGRVHRYARLCEVSVLVSRRDLIERVYHEYYLRHLSVSCRTSSPTHDHHRKRMSETICVNHSEKLLVTSFGGERCSLNICSSRAFFRLDRGGNKNDYRNIVWGLFGKGDIVCSNLQLNGSALADPSGCELRHLCFHPCIRIPRYMSGLDVGPLNIL